MSFATNGAPRSAPARRRTRTTERSVEAANTQPILVVEPPEIKGPFPIEKDPLTVEYEVVARLLLPAKDAEVIPSVSIRDTPQHGECLDVQWMTSDEREPRGVWERSVVIALPRQFAIAAYTVTGAPEPQEREAGA